MANCLLKQNILKKDVCGYSLNKVVDIYLANFSEITAAVSGNEVTAITMATGTSVYHIEPSRDSASFTDELQVTDSGAKYRTHTVNFTIDSGSYDKDLAQVIDDLSLGRYTAVCKLASKDEKYIMLGRVAPLEATVVTLSGAASASDANGIQVTLVADIAEVALPLSSAAVTSLLENVASE